MNYQVLVPILRCPVTHARLRWLMEPELQDLNGQIDQGQLIHLDGTQVLHPLQAGLIADAVGLTYRIQDGIVMLLASLAMLPLTVQSRFLSGAEPAIKVDVTQLLSPDKQAVQAFYDQVGWQQNPEQVYQDAARFEDLRPVSEIYRRRCHLRVNQYLQKPGRFLLDVASGPIQYEEYLSYSEGYDYRICGDISLRALQQAQAKLGDRGFYLLCDLTQLPIQSHSLDGAVSLHTVYHIPASEQATAFRELHRVLKPGATAAVVYSWSGHSRLMQLSLLPVKGLRFLWKRLQPGRFAARETGEPGLYFYTHSYAWFLANLSPAMPLDIVVWRSINVLFMQSYLFGWLGQQFLHLLYSLENRFPRWWGRMGAYPIIVIQKQEGS